jgi:hypothetical protein
MIVIFSSARSGSTWLGKILDSHPDTIYLHEPDIVDRGTDLLEYWFDCEPTRKQIDFARIYLQRLLKQRSLRAVGTRPFFPKNHRNDVLSGLRVGMIYAGKAAERVWPAMGERLAIPDLSGGKAASRVVLKSVSALGRAEVLIRSAEDQIKPVLLLRNPCAIVQSFLKGISSGEMEAPPEISKVLATRSARLIGANGLSGDLDVVDRLSWAWVIANAEALAAVDAAGGIVLHYEDLAADPEGVSRDLFARLGLEWSARTADFLTASAVVKEGYYSLSRDPKEAANVWKRKMDPEILKRVHDIVCQHPLGKAYFNA